MGKKYYLTNNILKQMAEAIRKLTGFSPVNWDAIVDDAVEDVRSQLREGELTPEPDEPPETNEEEGE